MNTYKRDRRILYAVTFSDGDYIYLAKKPKKLAPDEKMYKVVKTMFHGIISKKRIFG